MSANPNNELESREVSISTPPQTVATGPTVEQQWLAAWRIASQQLPLIQQRELGELTDEQGTRQATWLGIVVPQPTRPSSGLVEWQHLMLQMRADGN